MLIDPRLHESNACKGCSPQGLVASIRPMFLIGFFSLMRSMKMIPGSPVRCACSTMRFHISPTVQAAFERWPSSLRLWRTVHSLVRGFITWCTVFGSVRSSSRNRSVIETEML